MIAVDASALVAIGLCEPGRVPDNRPGSPKALISTVSVVEARVVLFGRGGPRAVVLFDDLPALRRFEIR